MPDEPDKVFFPFDSEKMPQIRQFWGETSSGNVPAGKTDLYDSDVNRTDYKITYKSKDGKIKTDTKEDIKKTVELNPGETLTADKFLEYLKQVTPPSYFKNLKTMIEKHGNQSGFFGVGLGQINYIWHIIASKLLDFDQKKKGIIFDFTEFTEDSPIIKLTEYAEIDGLDKLNRETAEKKTNFAVFEYTSTLNLKNNTYTPLGFWVRFANEKAKQQWLPDLRKYFDGKLTLEEIKKEKEKEMAIAIEIERAKQQSLPGLPTPEEKVAPSNQSISTGSPDGKPSNFITRFTNFIKGIFNKLFNRKETKQKPDVLTKKDPQNSDDLLGKLSEISKATWGTSKKNPEPGPGHQQGDTDSPKNTEEKKEEEGKTNTNHPHPPSSSRHY